MSDTVGPGLLIEASFNAKVVDSFICICNVERVELF